MYDFLDLPFDSTQYSDAARPLACPWGDRTEEITSIVVEDGVTGIGNAAFQIGIGLTSVSLPDSVERIGDHAFYGSVFCAGRMDFPKSLKVIGTGAFAMCESLTFSDLPEGVRYLGPSAFADCPGLKSVTIPQGVKAVPNYAFQLCSALESVTLPVSVTSIGQNAFLLCSGFGGQRERRGEG